MEHLVAACGGDQVRCSPLTLVGSRLARRKAAGIGHRQHSGDAVVEARTTLHVMDGESRVAMIDTKTVGSGLGMVVRYQLGNHLGSVAVELDEDGDLISYEEYYPPPVWMCEGMPSTGTGVPEEMV